MIIKKIAKKNGFDIDDFEKYLIEQVGVKPVPNLRNYDLENRRVAEMVEGYQKYRQAISSSDSFKEAPLIKCDHCGKEILEDSVFCNYCGVKLEKKLFCRKCGTQIPTDSVFCQRCGTRISD